MYFINGVKCTKASIPWHSSFSAYTHKAVVPNVDPMEFQLNAIDSVISTKCCFSERQRIRGETRQSTVDRRPLVFVFLHFPDIINNKQQQRLHLPTGQCCCKSYWCYLQLQTKATQ